MVDYSWPELVRRNTEALQGKSPEDRQKALALEEAMDLAADAERRKKSDRAGQAVQRKPKLEPPKDPMRPSFWARLFGH